MTPIALNKKRKNIDLPIETLQKLSIMAAAQGKSLKALIENILVTKADMLNIEVSTNPSPSGDSWFENQDNLKLTEQRAKFYKEGNNEKNIVATSAEDIVNLINRL